MIIKAKQLSKIYGSNNNKVIALNNVNLEINSGEFVSVIGPSGSGKSTLLHILSGLDNPTSGQVLLDDKDIYKHTEKELSALRRKSFGFVFQQFNLLPVLTASENISMPVLLDKKQPDKDY
ncbi:ABC transporter family protein [Clostridioides difficile 6042]|nr:ABC transporter family protein [Clostridioides difficile 6042]